MDSAGHFPTLDLSLSAHLRWTVQVEQAEKTADSEEVGVDRVRGLLPSGLPPSSAAPAFLTPFQNAPRRPLPPHAQPNPVDRSLAASQQHAQKPGQQSSIASFKSHILHEMRMCVRSSNGRIGAGLANWVAGTRARWGTACHSNFELFSRVSLPLHYSWNTA